MRSTSPFSWYGLAPAMTESIPELVGVSRFHPSYSSGTISYTDAGGQRHAQLEASERGGYPLAFDGRLYLDVAGSDAFDFTESDYSISARIKTTEGGTILSKSPAEGRAPKTKRWRARRSRSRPISRS